jgi:UDP-N-acetylmuramoylalanine--D-glutamate ligase
MHPTATPSLSLKGRPVLVLGLGDTGLATTRWLAAQGACVRVADTRAHPPHEKALHAEHPEVALLTGAFTAQTFADITLVVASPGVPLSEPEVAAAQARGLEVVGDVELFARTLQACVQPPRVVAITGANGKTTVTTMVGDIVQAAGLRCAVVGNIGTPVLEALTTPLAEVFVLELSSFQLETTEHLTLAGATVLNVTEDHMDRYADMAAYAAAKARIFKHCVRRVVNREDAASRAMANEGSVSFGLDAPAHAGDWGLKTIHGQTMICCGENAVMALSSLPLTGMHNAANAMAALALSDALNIDRAIAVHALQQFKGLPHRVEKVAEHAGVSFYDDSKGTNVGATVAALQGMVCPVVLIAGGDGKGQDFSPLGSALKTRARALIVIGRDGPKIASAAAQCGVPVEQASDMLDAVRRALRLARPGDAVLLSPACASFDMFDNYVHRARVFVEAVQACTSPQEVGDE